MKKLYIGIGVGLIIIGGVAAALLLSKKEAANTQDTSEPSFTTYEACKLLTKDKAAEILGTPATLGQEPSPNNSDDLKVTNCVFNNNASNGNEIVSISVLVRSPLTQAGASSNEEVFTTPNTVGGTTVTGYGEKAAWNSSTGQLNILKDKNWIIITFGKSQPGIRTVEDTKKAADIVLR